MVQELSWAELWPEEINGKSTWFTDDERPCFQHYCLVGVKGSYTDWHIDMAGTSVYYHIHKGKKLFLLVIPTEKNLAIYEGKRYV